MRIRAEQLVTMVIDVHARYARSRSRWDPHSLHDLLVHEYPDLDGVFAPPSFDDILHDYVPPTWVGAMQIHYQPERPQIRPLFDRPLTPLPVHIAEGPRWESGSRRDAWAPLNPPPDPVQQILRDLDLLRSDPMAAMTYVCLSARGLESPEAMNWARLTSNVWALAQIHPAFIRADQRAEGTRQAAEGVAGARQRAFHEAWAPQATVQAPPLPLVPDVQASAARSSLEDQWGR